MEVDLIPQERGYKQNSVWSSGSAGSKMFLTMLAKVVTFHMRLTMVDVQGFGLELVSKSRSTLLRGLEEQLNDSNQVLLAIGISVRILER